MRLPVISEDENATLDRLLKQLAARQQQNMLRASYYDGKRMIRHIGSVIPPEYLRMAGVFGWCAKAVDTLARRCNLDAFVWPDGDLDSLGYKQVWDANMFAAESNSAMVSSLIHGVAFLVNTTGGDGEPDSLIHVKSALNATGEWNVRTRALDNLLSITARDQQGDPTELNLYLDGKTIVAEKSLGTWSVDIKKHPWGVPAEPLVYKPRVERPLGSARISTEVMGIQDRAARASVRMEANADVYSLPQMILLGANEGQFKNPDGSLKPSWKVALGRVFVLPDDEEAPESLARASVQQFQAASPQPHIDMLKQAAQEFAGATSIPLTSLGVSDMSNPTSADSYIASREDLIAEAEGATDDWSPAFKRAELRALAMVNNLKEIPDEWSTIEPKFRSPLYLSRAAQADAGLKQLTAVPWLADTEVGLELLGLDEQQVRRAMAQKRLAGVSALVDKLTATGEPPAPAPGTAEQAAVSAQQGS